MYNMLFEGPVYDISGYACAAREMIKSWKHIGLDFKIRPNYQWSQLGAKLTGEEYSLLNSLIDRTTPADQFNAVYQMQRQNHGDNGKCKIVHTMFETDSVPELWYDMLRSADEILIPSSFGVNVFKNAGFANVRYMPFSVDTDLFSPTAPKYINSPEFKFLFMGDFSPRKNLDMLLHAFMNTFRGNKDVMLVIKSFAHREKFLPTIMDKLKNIRNQLRSEFPKILFFPNATEDSVIPGLINSCDCFVSTSHGEGFGIPILYSMACEKPVISIPWSSCADYITMDCSFPLEYSIKPVPYAIVVQDANFFNHSWADPSTEHLCNLMNDIVSQRGSPELKQMGELARQKVIDLYSKEAVQERMVSFFSERRLI